MLRNLADSSLVSEVVFKGGTALSKAYRLVDRFSEDVNLVVLLAGRTLSAVKALLRDVYQAAVAVGMAEELPEVPGNGKWGQIRRIYHRYPYLFERATADVAEDILLEITAFGQPYPIVRLPLVSYVGEVFAQQEMSGELTEFGLLPFDFNVLWVGRTFAEKIMALVRALSELDPAVEVASKVRHLCNLHHLMRHPKVQALLANDELFALWRAVQTDDAVAGVKGPTREWKVLPLNTCWAYRDAGANLQQVAKLMSRTCLICSIWPPQNLHSFRKRCSGLLRG